MADPKRALEIIKQYYATVTPERFLNDVRRAIPKEESPDDELFDEWVKQKKERICLHDQCGLARWPGARQQGN
jgi:uncharacterized protein HemY